MHLHALLLLPLLLLLGQLVGCDHAVDLGFGEEGNAFVEDFQMHFDYFWLVHEEGQVVVAGVVRSLFAKPTELKLVTGAIEHASGGANGLAVSARAAFGEHADRSSIALSSRLHELRSGTVSLHLLQLQVLLLNEHLVLQCVFTGEVLEVFNVLLVDLLEDLLQILGLGALHVSVELLLLLFSEQVDLIDSRYISLDLGGVSKQLRLSGKNLGNLLLLFSRKVLVDSVLH